MPTLRLPFREQLAEARKIDRLRACPSGRKCKVACSAPHVEGQEAHGVGAQDPQGRHRRGGQRLLHRVRVKAERNQESLKAINREHDFPSKYKN